MAYKYREEIVGKRFLSVSGFTKLKLGKIGEWGWRAGVIRAASHKDSSHPDLQVLVEYDDVEWHRREWISIYKDSLFHLFMVEHSLVWTDRLDPLSSNRSSTVLWPALSFKALVATVDLASNQQPLEFLLDRELIFRDYARLQPFQEWDPKLPGLRDYPELRAAVRRWSELQDGQRILVTTPSVLVGYRVEVYRAEGTTQWYTAVIVSYNEATRDLTVTDDTVLEEHNEDPCIVQMRLIGDGVVESIMKGENVGITPRRSRSSAVLTQHQQQQLPSRVGRSSSVTPSGGPTGGSSSSSSSGGSGANTRSYNTNTGAAPVSRKLRTGKLPPTGESPAAAEAAATPTAQTPLGSSEKEGRSGTATSNTKTRGDRKRKSAESAPKTRANSSASDVNKEDLENKGNKKRNTNRGAKKKVLEEANNSKLRRHVQVRVEDCLHRTAALRSCKKESNPSPPPAVVPSPEEPPVESAPGVEVPPAADEAPDPVQPDIETTEIQKAGDEPKRQEQEEAKVVKEVEEKKKEEEQKKEPTPPPPSPSPPPVTQEKAKEQVKEEVVAEEESKPVVVDSRTRKDEEVSVETEDGKSEGSGRCSVVLDEKGGENEEKCNSGSAVQEEVSEPSVIIEDRTSSGQPTTSSQDDDDGPLSSSSPFGRMELSGGDSSAAALLRFPDDRSDSGVSSLRSGSGDERSGSRSSALSSSDEPPQQNQLPPTNRSPLFLPSSSSSSGSSSSDKLTTPPKEPVSVWRDPSLLLVAEPQVRHINSVQHQTLLMSHPSTPAAAAQSQPPTSSSAAAAAAVVSQAQALALAQHYQTVVPPPPPLLTPHALHHHHPPVPHLPPPAIYTQLSPEMLWSKRYAPLPVGTHLLAPAHPAPEEYLAERERERVFRERQNQEAREHKEREKERERLERERERQEREKLERERQEREKMERERQEHDRQERERLEKQRLVDQAVHKHFEESLRLAQQKQDRERLEKQRLVDQAVHNHFEESLRSAQQKQDRERLEKHRLVDQAVHNHFEESLRSKRNMGWSIINSLPPPRGSGTEEERKRVEHDVSQQQQRLIAERLRQERFYPGVPRQPSGSKDYAPPPAHSRVSGSKSDKPSSGHAALPKAEPNFNLFGYPYHPGAGMIPSHDGGKGKQDQMKAAPSSALASLVTTKSASAPIGMERERDVMLPNPPPLMSDIKNSVIVKNDGKSPHHPHETSKVPSSHSSSPKLRVGDMVTSQQPHYLPPTSLSQHKAAYDYRSPNQSPHHIAPRHSPSPHHAHMTMEPQNLVGKGMQGHHRSNQQSSPHSLPHRQSPHAMQQQPHPSPPEQRYGSATGPNPLPYGSSKTATVGSYPYPSPAGHVTTTHYALATGGSVTAGSKPKVSSPAPPHIYGKPGITTGTPVCRAQDTVNSGPLPLTSKAPHTSSVSPSPYQQMSPHHPPPPHPASAGPPPPPAHRGTSGSSMVGDPRGIYDRLYAGSTGHSVKPPSQHQGSSPPSASAAPHPNSRSSPLQIPHQSSSHHMAMTPVFQTQPLDLGVSSDRGNNRDDLSGSPKRKGVPAHHSPIGMGIDATKKRRSDQPNLPPQMLSQGLPALAQPLLSRVSEPSPLIASAATTITTVVNTAAYCTPAATTMMVSMSHEPSAASTTVSTSPSTVPARTESGDGSVRPSSTCSSPGLTAIYPTTQQQRNSPVPLAPPASSSSPNLAAQQQCSTHTPVKPPQPPPSSVDSDKSNSPGPVRPTTGSSYPVHKLKKAWLQRHSGEDGMEDTTGIVGSGSCVTLPLNLGTSTPTVTGTNKETVNSANSVSSLQNVGSLKGKPNSNKGNNRKGPSSVGSKDGIGVTLNGHASDIPSSKHSRPEDSSSSDAEREQKSPPKRKPPKMKRKKGGGGARKAVEEKRKKLTPVAAHSESGSDSDKESVTDKDSDSGASTNQSSTTGKKSANGGGGSSTSGGGGGNKEPRKRGRRPKSSKNDRGEEPRQKKSRDDPPAPQRDPFRKPPVSQLKKTGESFLQDGPCHEVAPKLAKCRECRWTPNQRSKNMPNIFCRFYAFRRLRYTKNGQLAIAGFSDPHRDAAEEDLKLWLPMPESPPADLDPDMAKLLIIRVGDQFCDLLEQEKECLAIHMAEDKTIAWKRVVQGVREMCDVCETTLFNFHWACNKCGFVVCIDCYKGRKNGSIKIWGEPGKDRDDFSWLLCTNRQAHEQEKLMLTQIIAGDSLLQLGKKVHEVRALWGIPQYCGCQMSKESIQKSTNGICKDLLSIFKNEPLNGIIRPEKKEKDSEGTDEDEDDDEKKKKKNGTANGAIGKQDDQNSPLNWLADVALSNEDKKACEDSGGSSSDSDEDKDGRYSTLRELLIRPSHKPNGSGSRSASPANNMTNLSSGGLNSNSTNAGTNSANSKKSTNNTGSSSASNSNTAASSTGTKSSKKPKIGIDTLDEVISFVVEDKVPKEEIQSRKEELQISSAPVDEKPPMELKHYTRRYKVPQRAFPIPIRIMTQCESTELYPEIPHSWLCDGKLLRLNDPNLEGNYHIFQDMWKRGQPVIVSDVTKHLDMTLWHPESFIRDFGEEKNDLINCMTGNLVPNQPMRKFWEGFEHFSRRLKDDRGNPMLLKLKDWPPGEDFAEMLPSRFSDLMKVLPLSEYTHRTGRLNLASRLPDCFVRPDLGPKMYNAYGSALYPSKGTTNLHLDISDAVNVMVYVGIPKDGNFEDHIKEAFRAIDEAGCDILTRRRVREKGELPGALWHIYHARDADKIRDLLNKVAIERGARLEPHHDPIHDQSWYLDGALRERLYREYNVDGYAIVQCLGDSVFIPAGAPHQVRNLHNCIKVAEDFVSPENVSHCFHLTQEFRSLSDTHSNHEDKLQIKNIIYHAVKDSLSVLTNIARGSKRCKQFLANLGSGSAGGDNGTNGSAARGETSPANGSNDDEEEAKSRSPNNVDSLEKKEIKKEPAT